MTDETSATLQRLDDQISWYNSKSETAQRWFKFLKIIQFVTAGVIPLIALFGVPAADKISAVLGLTILVVEGLQQLNQYQANWISYRTTAEALRHEKYLFLAHAGPYSNAERPIALLAEHIEGLVSQENKKWIRAQESVGKARS
jgi:hypothetical protein